MFPAGGINTRAMSNKALDASGFCVIGHRGARGHAPENTLQALEAGIRLGADGLECDVQLHPDGKLYLLHDLRVDRTTNGHGAFAQLSAVELRRLDAGGGQQIPTLDEALDLVGRRVRLNVELKSFGATAEAVAKTLLERVRAGWSARQFLVSSFHLPELRRFRQQAPEIPVAALVCGVPLDGAACATELGAETLNIDAEFADPGLITDARGRGLQVYAYTVNQVEDMRRLQGLGVTGVFTDYPERARDLF